MKDESSLGGYRRSRLRNGLLVAQIALSLVMLVAAGLMFRALQQLRDMNPGSNSQNALMMSVDLGLQGYDRERGEHFYRQLVERVSALPGVRSSAVTNYVPLSLNYSSTDIYVEGKEQQRGANQPTAMYRTRELA